MLEKLIKTIESLHRIGYIHRDIRPFNIILLEDERKMLYFGIRNFAYAFNFNNNG